MTTGPRRAHRWQTPNAETLVAWGQIHDASLDDRGSTAVEALEDALPSADAVRGDTFGDVFKRRKGSIVNRR